MYLYQDNCGAVVKTSDENTADVGSSSVKDM